MGIRGAARATRDTTRRVPDRLDAESPACRLDARRLFLTATLSRTRATTGSATSDNWVMRDIPDRVRLVVERWVGDGAPGQPPIRWPRQRWLKDFPGNAAALARLPDRLDRAAVRTACADASRSPAQAVEAFLAVMAWGFGDSVGYGRYRTGRILASRSDSAPRLHAVAQAIVTDGPLAGYRALASPGVSRLRGLGPSFGTKLLYFWQPADRRPRALILDAFVANWLEREVDWRLDHVPWSVDTYRRYLDQMHAWAEALGIEPDELEMCIFHDEASRRGSQWGDQPTDPSPPVVVERRRDLPFPSYPQGGRTLLGKPRWGDGTARRSYGVKALEWCGYRCAYCGLDLSTFEGWLQLSIDHVIPQQMQTAGYPSEWVLDAINLVAACMACNGYFNRDPVVGEVPATLEAFCDIRDRIFSERKARILERRETERAWFNTHIRPVGQR